MAQFEINSRPDIFLLSGNAHSTNAAISQLAIHPSLKFWTLDGKPWRYVGCTGFQLMDRYAKGENVQPFLDAYAGYNVVRIFPYVGSDWGTLAWTWPSHDSALSFVRMLATQGWRANICLLTDDASSNIPVAENFISALAQEPNVLWEAGNEPLTHKSINVDALKSVLQATGQPYTCGRYEDETAYWGSYGNDHPRDDGDDQIRGAGHGLMEWWDGDGPEINHPADRMPWIVGEMDRPDSPNIKGPDDYLAIAASCALFGAGGTMHTQSGKWALLPGQFPAGISGNSDEAACIASFAQGMAAFPADACLGAYSHDTADEQKTGSLRTYRIGPYGVRIRPQDGSPILIGV